MALNHNQTVSVLYDLAMTMAGETRPYPLAQQMLQRLLVHTGCACGAVLLDPRPASSGWVHAQTYVAVGNYALRNLEGQSHDWPATLFAGEQSDSSGGWFPGGERYPHAITLLLPGQGYAVLFSSQSPGDAAQRLMAVFKPVLGKFSRSLRLCLDGEAHEHALAVARDAAEAGNRAKSLFLTSVSHELRTPLNAILGYTQLMDMYDDLPQAVRENVSEINEAGQQLLGLVNGMLDLASIESGELQFDIAETDPVEVLDACHRQNAAAARARQITLGVPQGCSGRYVLADTQRLLLALNNLVANAIKYNREGGNVFLACNATQPGWVRIAISDNGPGIPAELRNQLFQTFNRLGAEAGAIGGAGIGLSIVRQLIEGMGGRVGVDSRVGAGSTFWVELPAVTSSVSRPPRILVAEDYPPNQALLKVQLANLGYPAEIAGDGAVALEMWLRDRHELVLTDLNMPVMNGLELAGEIRRHEQDEARQTPLIAITAAAVPSEIERCRQAGISDVLTKPIDLEALRKVLARWLPAAPASAPAPSAAPPGGTDEVLDIARLYRIMGDISAEHAAEMVEMFIRLAGEGLARLANQSSDAEALARELHKQKSSARSVGAVRYADLAESLEKQAREGTFPALDPLRTALTEVIAAARRLPGTTAAAAPPPPPSAPPCSSVLVVDDDPLVLRQMGDILNGLGIREVITAENGLQAIRVMGERGNEFDALVCDLNMPEMDGVELIRLFGRSAFRGGLILMSGADETVLRTVSELAALHGLRVLGQAQKPVSAQQVGELLGNLQDVPVRRHSGEQPDQIDAEAIRAAIAANQFSVWLQPKVDAFDLAPTGVEALARWRRPDGGFVPPDVFIVVAEREGVIAELSRLLVTLALREGARLFAAGFPLKIAVNLSGRWLNDLNLPDFLEETTLSVGLRAADVILEVTETGVMEDLTTALDVLTRVRIKGFGLSIDDFGIGYSSFEQLGRIPFTELKLDRSFVIRGDHDPAARAILEGSMDMARKLKLSTVAEGVEEDGQLALIRSLGCNNVQGYLVAKPMPCDTLLAWLRERREGTSR